MPELKHTQCVDCAAPMAYTTKKPLKCQKCRGPKKKSKKTSGPKWKTESSIFKMLGNIFKGYEQITNGYYSFLPSPKGATLQLDWYCPEYRLAVEYNGIQHYSQSKFLRQSKQDFAYLQECDKLKKELCAKLGITLIEISYKEKITKENIISIIKANRKDVEI